MIKNFRRWLKNNPQDAYMILGLAIFGACLFAMTPQGMPFVLDAIFAVAGDTIEGPRCDDGFEKGMTAAETAELVGVPLVEFEHLPASFNPTPQTVSVTKSNFDSGPQRCGINLIYTAPPKLPNTVYIRVEVKHQLTTGQIRSGTPLPPTPQPDHQIEWACWENTIYSVETIPTICSANLNGYSVWIESPYQLEGTELLLSRLRPVD